MRKELPNFERWPVALRIAFAEPGAACRPSCFLGQVTQEARAARALAADTQRGGGDPEGGKEGGGERATRV
jgi:hypothetical protein